MWVPREHPATRAPPTSGHRVGGHAARRHPGPGRAGGLRADRPGPGRGARRGRRLGAALTDAGSGALTELQPHTYTPGAAVARLVRLRDRTCRFPGCTIPARRCDLDHREPLDHRNPASGGTTTPDNLFALCRYHHRTKTLGVWTYTHAGGAVVEWTSPTGSTHTTWPPDYGGSSPPEDDSPLR